MVAEERLVDLTATTFPLPYGGGRVVEGPEPGLLPATHTIGMLARAVRLPEYVHVYFHDTDLLERKRVARARVRPAPPRASAPGARPRRAQPGFVAVKKITFANRRRWSGASRPATNRSCGVLEVGEQRAHVGGREEMEVRRVDLGMAPGEEAQSGSSAGTRWASSRRACRRGGARDGPAPISRCGSRMCSSSSPITTTSNVSSMNASGSSRSAQSAWIPSLARRARAPRGRCRRR